MELAEKERNSGFPIIGRGVCDLLMVLMGTVRPRRILELGTGVGYSSIIMATYDKSLEKITTVELKEDNRQRALKNIRDFGFEDKIDCILGDATKIFKENPGLSKEYDFIFVDCAKAQYAGLWEYIRLMIKPGGIILTDDILQDDSIVRSRFLLNRRERTTHKRMRQYLYDQMNDPEFTGAVFEIDDGVSLVVRNDSE